MASASATSALAESAFHRPVGDDPVAHAGRWSRQRVRHSLCVHGKPMPVCVVTVCGLWWAVHFVDLCNYRPQSPPFIKSSRRGRKQCIPLRGINESAAPRNVPHCTRSRWSYERVPREADHTRARTDQFCRRFLLPSICNCQQVLNQWMAIILYSPGTDCCSHAERRCIELIRRADLKEDPSDSWWPPVNEDWRHGH